jgi:phospholipase C
MSGIRRFSAVGGVIGFFCLLLNLSGCGSSSSTTTTPPSPSYTLTASALTPSSVTIGSPATSTLTVTPVNGYTGTVTVSCSVTGGGTPAPICSPASINVTGTTAVNSTLTVPTAGSIPGTYTFTLTAKDANNLAPSNGSQQLTLAVTAPAGPSYSLSASALNPSTVTAGNTSTSTVTITPANGYTGSVSLSCSSPVGTSVPTCSFNPSTVTINGAAATSALTVSSTASTPGGPYNVTIAASDTNNLGPSNGSQTLPLVVNAVIQHVVIIFQENRSTDNLFQGLCIAPYGSATACSSTPSSTQYNIQNFGINSLGQTIPLSPIDLGNSLSTPPPADPDDYDISHAHGAFEDMCQLNVATGVCAMNGADLEGTCTPGVDGCPQNPQFMYVNPADVAAYLQMAQTYTFADHMFQTNQGPSFPAHQFILSGTSAPTATSNLFASENPLHGFGNVGCIAPAGATVEMIDPTGLQNTTMYPCFEHPTLTDLLDNAGITWRYYAPSAGSIWTAPNAIEHMCVPSAPTGGTCTGPDYTGASPKVVLNQTQANAQVLTDISSNQLQQVSWVIPSGHFSDHSGANLGCGPSWVTQVVNAIGNSPYWSNTVIIVAWDDWGGWYDHVPPPQVLANCTQWGCGYVYGFRVPMIVISPYNVQSGYVSHVTHDFGSILKFVETNFNLPSLGYADAPADDLSDFFNYDQSPTVFQAITPPADTSDCVGNSDASDPDDD